MKTITITNNFHHTEHGIRLTDEQHDDLGQTGAVEVKRARGWLASVRRALCCDGCTCSGADGTRGSKITLEIDDESYPAWELITIYS